MRTKGQPRKLLLLTVALGFTLAVLQSGQPVSAQDEGAEQHSDWAPFVGEFEMYCTKSTGQVGSCFAHHKGWAIDINLPYNAPIYSAGPGVVVWTADGCLPRGGDPGCHNGAGNYVVLDHGDHFSRYIHLASFAPGMEIGTPVAAGQVVGYAGASGTSGSGSEPEHLHYDEIENHLTPTTRIFFGPMLACHGDTAVQYPDAAGFSDWQSIPHGTVIRNDGYECLGGVTPDPPPPPPPPPPPVDPGPGGAVGLAFGDFDKDGNQDLLVGVPGEGIRKRGDAGMAVVIYGANSGPGRNEALRQGNKILRGRAEAGDMFGASTTTGDFNGDGYDDAAIGIPGEDIWKTANAGAVSVSYGSASDVRNRPVVLRQGKWGIPGPREAGDLAGAALASGDFDGDGYDDLAIGVPGEDIGALVDAGAVMIIYGTADGFTSSSPKSGLLYQGNGFAGFTEAGDLVGAALAVGDFNCDGYDDLAAGVPGESIDAHANAGAVSVIYGANSGLGASPKTLYQSSGLAGILESGDRVGIALAAGNFNGDSSNGHDCDDLAVGAPSEDLTGGSDAGAVSVVFGSNAGLATSTVHFQTEGGLGQKIGHDDNVGAALAAVDINCDGFDDLAVGAPGETISGQANSGWVGIMRGSASGMGGPIASLHQGGGLPGLNESGDALGSSLAAGDANNDGCGDLAIGVPGEGIRRRNNAGRVIVVRGSASGPTTATSHYQTLDLPGRSESGDFLGGPGISTLLGLSLQ